MTNVFEIPIVANFTYEIHYLAFHMLTLVNESNYVIELLMQTLALPTNRVICIRKLISTNKDRLIHKRKIILEYK